MDFKKFLKDNGMKYGPNVTDESKKQLEDFFKGIPDEENIMLDAEAHDLLDNYKILGLIEDIDSDDSANDIKIPPKKITPGEAITNVTSTAANAITAFGNFLNAGYEARKEEDDDDPYGFEAARKFEEAERNGTLDKQYTPKKPAKNIRQPAENKIPKVKASRMSRSVKKTGNNEVKLIYSSAKEASAQHPILIISDPKHEILHHQVGVFTDPKIRKAFQFYRDNTVVTRKIKAVDSRFVKILEWLGSGYIGVMLSGLAVSGGYAVYNIRAVSQNDNESVMTANNDFLQLVIRRMLDSDEIRENKYNASSQEADTADPEIILSDMAALRDFLSCTEDALPDNIRNWAHRNIAMVNSSTLSPEEKRHAQRALSLMLNIHWEGSYFNPIDPVRARQILDQQLYGLEKVKQRVIETIIQINRTHTLPSYGLLLAGPAGTGKSQIAYAVAKILGIPWTSLDMSAIHDTEQLTGSPRVYSNAKPGKIMEALSTAGASNLVLIINELDKAGTGKHDINPSDALLTLLDNLGFTDNYIECRIPTGGIYPIATANDIERISSPLLSRFALIEIPDYTTDEKKTIFKNFSMPKILKKLGMQPGEIILTDDAIDAVIERYQGLPGVRDLEQAAEHIAANALYRIETKNISTVRFDRAEVTELLGN